MEKLGVKTTFYDLIGYVVPGALLVLFIAKVCAAVSLSMNHVDILQSLVSLNIYSFLGLIALSYVAGHFLAALSSGIIEKGLCCWVGSLSEKTTVKSVVPSLHLKIKEKFEEHFGVEFDSESIKLMMTVVEEYMPRAYSTAFIFLSLYGMARNFTLIFLIAAVGDLCLLFVGRCVSFFMPLGFLVLSIIFFLQYVKFRRCFINQICDAYLIHRTDKDKAK